VRRKAFRPPPSPITELPLAGAHPGGRRSRSSRSLGLRRSRGMGRINRIRRVSHNRKAALLTIRRARSGATPPTLRAEDEREA